MKNLILGLVLTVVSISGLAGFSSVVAAESTIPVVNTVSNQYRYEYRRLNSEWVMKLTYRNSDSRLMDIDIIHEEN